MTSVVCEHHDSPSLKHLDELSTEIFDSPRVQVGGEEREGEGVRPARVVGRGRR